MMKRKTLIRTVLVLSLVLMMGLLAGCTGEDSDKPDTPPATDATASDNQNETGIPGTYTVPDGWVVMEQYTTENKIFYVEEGHENDELPDNISIEVGTNRYSVDEHPQFRDAIVRQLTMQLQDADAQITGDGTYTDQDYILYIFTITEEGCVTTQYYIVDDHRYCLIHLTNFSGSESANEAVQTMVDSFVWD